MMKSCVSVTEQIDDAKLAAEELLQGIQNQMTLQKNTVGILFSYSDMDMKDLVKEVSQAAPYKIIGCSGIANMDEKQGFHSMAVTLTVLTADDCSFAVSTSGSITPENVNDEIEKTVRTAIEELGSTPKLLFAIPPYILEIMLDTYSTTFNRVLPGVPVIGGLPSYNGNGDQNLTFSEGSAWADRLVMIAVSGNVKPVFSVQNVKSDDISRKREVTLAKNNIVYEVNGEPFTQYLKEIGLPVETLAKGNATITFVSNPLLLESPKGEKQQYSFVRTLHEINLENGSGTAIGKIPQGSILSICALKKEEIEQAAIQGMRELKEKMEKESKEGYRFSTILTVSCIGRHLLLLPHNDAEVKNLLSEIPTGITLSGFYSYGELGPQGKDRIENFSHNESLILCAF